MVTAALGLAAMGWLCTPAQAQQWTITLDAQPQRIAADGRSTSQITARVSSPETGPAPDGTEVRFTTTGGSIVPVARTTAGSAVAVLTSGSTPNIAQITALVGGASATTQVEFVAGNFQAPDVVLTVVGDLAYSIDQGLLVASQSTLTHGNVQISADTLEFDESRGMVRAQGNVTISKGQTSVAADALWYSPEHQSGALLIAGRVNQEVAFRTDSLAIQDPHPAKDMTSFQAFNGTGTRSWIMAEKATIWPRERIQFTRAVVKVNGRQVLALPHYYYDYNSGGLNPVSEQLRYTSYEGLVLDLPFYFQFKRQESAGLRLRYAEKGSSYGGFITPRKGFSLGLEQDYDVLGGGGRMFVDSFPSADRSLEWTHNQTLRGGRLSASLRYQPLSNYARNALSGYSSYAWNTSGLDMTFAAYGSRSQLTGNAAPASTTGSLTTRLDARTRGRPIGKSGLAWRGMAGLVRGPIGATSSGTLQTGLYQTLGLGISERPIGLVGGANLTLDSTLERTFGVGNSTSLRGRAILERPLGHVGDISLTWDQEFAGGASISSPYRKSLTGTLSVGSPTGFRSYAYLSYLPDDHSTSLQITASKPLIKGVRLEVSHNFSRAVFTDPILGTQLISRFGYTEVSLVKPVGLLDLSFNWSPEGRDYGLQHGHNFWFEMGARAF